VLATTSLFHMSVRMLQMKEEMCVIIRNLEENSCETSIPTLIHECQGIYKMLKVCFNP